MQLKEFSLLVPVIESGTVLKALETAIPSSAIEQAINETKAREERKRALPSHFDGLLNHCHEFVVKGFDENSTKKSS